MPASSTSATTPLSHPCALVSRYAPITQIWPTHDWNAHTPGRTRIAAATRARRHHRAAAARAVAVLRSGWGPLVFAATMTGMNAVAGGPLYRPGLEARLRQPATLTPTSVPGWRRVFRAAFPGGLS